MGGVGGSPASGKGSISSSGICTRLIDRGEGVFVDVTESNAKKVKPNGLSAPDTFSIV